MISTWTMSMAILMVGQLSTIESFIPRQIPATRFGVHPQPQALPTSSYPHDHIRQSRLFSSIPEVSDDEEEEEEDYSDSLGANMQYDELPPYRPGMTDEEKAMLEAYRDERVIANDRWQSTMVRDNQGGEWSGQYELFVPTKGPSGFLMNRADVGSIESSIKASDFEMKGVTIFYKEQYASKAPAVSPLLTSTVSSLLLSPTRNSIESNDFRPQCGNQAVANSYTICQVSDGKRIECEPDIMDKFDSERSYVSIPETYVTELAIREENIRTRVRYAYTSVPTAAVLNTELKKQLYDIFLVGFVVIRECLTDAGPEAMQPLLAKTVGSGIYDPQASGDPYVQLNLSGKLSLLFPRGVNAARNPSRHVLTMEWEGKVMRFQVDRRFTELTDGRIKSLELTEVQAAEAEKYPPGFAIKPDYMQ